jgi:predicted short-subunit dehydrogenase-like oxidoreductase (DUF2520 family)
MNIVIIGAGRAGGSFAAALGEVHHVTLAHHDDPSVDPDADVDLVMLCVPDDAIATVARRFRATPGVLAHVSGSRSLDVLGRPRRVASLHPLAALPDAATGAARLRGGVFAVAGDPVVTALVASVGGRAIRVSDESRTLYHATATCASSHLVALMAHVEALARAAGFTLADFVPLARQSLDDVAARGPRAALTGPVSRGDDDTIAAHVAALPAAERETYRALAARAARVLEEPVEVPWSA